MGTVSTSINIGQGINSEGTIVLPDKNVREGVKNIFLRGLNLNSEPKHAN